MIDTTQMLQIMERVWQERTTGFTGLGVVFYTPPIDLPSTPLRGDVDALGALPVYGIDNIARHLSAASDLRSPWHDGFHFVDVAQLSLTHLAQYLAPTLASEVLPSGAERPSGARQMTALLTSNIPSVAAVAVISTAGDIRLYASGRLASKFTVLQ